VALVAVENGYGKGVQGQQSPFKLGLEIWNWAYAQTVMKFFNSRWMWDFLLATSLL
jgi:hypothetical protein